MKNVPIVLKFSGKKDLILFFLFLFLFCFLGLHHRHREVPSIGVNRSDSCWPTPQPQPRQIPDPLREARDGTHILMDISRIHFHRATSGTSSFFLFQPQPWNMEVPGPGIESELVFNPRHSCSNAGPLTH